MKKLMILFTIIFFLMLQGCLPAQWREAALPEEEEQTIEIILYFGSPDAIDTGQQGEYGYVTHVTREIPHTQEVLRASLEELIRGPVGENVYPVVHGSVEIIGINIDEGVAVIDLSEDMFGPDWVGGTLAGTVFVQSFVFTAAQFETVDSVQVLVEGEPWNDGHMIWDQPISPQDLVTEREDGPDAEIEEWVEYSRDLMLVQAREHEGELYILATYGIKPTGGYSVEIVDISDENNQDTLVVTVEFKEPAEEDIVTQALTRPYDLEIIDPVDIPIEFQAQGDEEFIPTLHGIDWLRPIEAGTENIKVFSPATHDIVLREFTVEGIENVFEGNVNYRVLDIQREELITGFTTGYGIGWGYFEIEVEVPEQIQSGDAFIVEVYAISAKDGSITDLVQLELYLE